MTGGEDYFYTLQEICVLLNLLPNTFRQIAREYSDLVAVREQVRKGRPVMGLPRDEFEDFRTIVEMRAHGSTGDEIRAAVAGRRRRAGFSAESSDRQAKGSLGRDKSQAVVGDGDGVIGGDEPGGGEPAGGEDRAAGDDGKAAGHDDRTPIDEDLGPGNPEYVVSYRPPPGFQAGEREGPADAGARVGAPAPGEVEPEVAAAEDSAAGLAVDATRSVPDIAGALQAELASLRDELRRMHRSRADEKDQLLSALMRTQLELQSLRYEVGVSLSRRDRKKRKRGFWAWLFDL
ncbi:MAG: hypothetical protein C4551_00145 [Bacillota bacterium]|nr:MAG: hypothetical protein C4551_00145 [Bacillota bacterium]